MQVRRDNSWDVLAGGRGGGSVFTPSMRRAVTIPMLQARKWTQRGRRVAPSHTLEGRLM